MSKNCSNTLIIQILIILFLFFLTTCGSSKLDLLSSDGIKWSEELNPEIKYNDPNWTTYTRGIDGGTNEITVEINNHPGGDFSFNWMMDRLGNNRYMNIYINGNFQTSCNNKEWQYPLGPFLINVSDKITLKLKIENIRGGRVWIAFPEGNSQFNSPPEKPVLISQPREYYNDTIYDFLVKSNDSDGDKIKYIFNWGDGNISEIGPLNSGDIASAAHSWRQANVYGLEITSLDEHGDKSKSSQMINIDVSWLSNVSQGENLTNVFRNIKNNTTILLERGNYSGPIDLENKENIRIRSIDPKNKARIISLDSNYAIGLDRTSHVTIKDLEICGGPDCIYLRNTHNNYIINNNIYFSSYGIRIINGSYDTIGDNYLEKVGPVLDSSPNGYAGICLNNTKNIYIYCNNIIGLSVSDGAYPAYKIKNSTWTRFDLFNSNSGFIYTDTCLCEFIDGALRNCTFNNRNHPRDNRCTIKNLGVCR
jgi:parallel beta-helix repeat protein